MNKINKNFEMSISKMRSNGNRTPCGNIVVSAGDIHPNQPETYVNILKKYPNHFPVMLLPGAIHLADTNKRKI